MNTGLIEDRLREMAIAYREATLLRVTWDDKGGGAVLEMHPLDLNRSCELKRVFRVKGNSLCFLGQSTRLDETFHKSDNPKPLNRNRTEIQHPARQPGYFTGE